MKLRLAATLAGAALAVAAPAAADTTTILQPPTRSPVVIAGSGLKQGDRLSDGQVLVRRITSVSAGDERTIRLTCPNGTVHAGIGMFDDSRLGFAALNRYPGQKVARLRVFASPLVPRGDLARGSVFALCATRAR